MLLAADTEEWTDGRLKLAGLSPQGPGDTVQAAPATALAASSSSCRGASALPVYSGVPLDV